MQQLRNSLPQVSLQKLKAELARRYFSEFLKYIKPQNSIKWFHQLICDKLDSFERCEIKKMMIFMPPQHGKSDLATRLFPSYLLGKNPARKIVVASYAAHLASSFNRDIQRIIDGEHYHDIFPNTQLNESNVTTDRRHGYLRNSEIFETVNYRGYVKTVGRGGPLTGTAVDIGIIDDPLKDREEAESLTVRESLWNWYTDVFESRMHNNSQQIVILTRWHEDDLAGRLLFRDNDWHVISLPAIKEYNTNAYDTRAIGEVLWEEKHSLERMLKIKEDQPITFQSLYQQNPKPKEGFMYKNLRTYKTLPNDAVRKKAVIDTADTGSDYLCCIIYVANKSGYYITDVYHTQDGMETTEPETAVYLTKHQVERARIESNNGGRGFARNVERECRILNNRRTAFEWYHQRDNKKVRIFNNSAEVQNMVYFPDGWDKMWPKFYSHITGYLANGNSEHDDAPDALTMIVEFEKNSDWGIKRQN